MSKTRESFPNHWCDSSRIVPERHQSWRHALWKATLLSLVVLLPVGPSGCAALLVGAGAAGGYAISKDSIQNRFQAPASEAYRISHEVVEAAGFITDEDERRRFIKASVDGADVTISVTPMSQRSIELKVRARRYVVFPKISVAQRLYNEIAQQLY